MKARGLGRDFGRRTIFGPFDLDVAPGERLVVVGPNGSGKTTLLRVLAGALRPSQGSVEAGRVAYVPTDASVHAELSPREHLRWVAGMHDVPVTDPWADAGLGRHADRPAAELSRGQRQRMHLAIALAVQPDTLILDEPWTGLDAAGEAWARAAVDAFAGAAVLAVHDDTSGTRLELAP